MVQRFSDNSNNPMRALQAWLILISKAYNRQTIRYADLSEMMGYSDPRPIPNILELVMQYCAQNSLPPLTVLVVNKATGAPGSGLITSANTDADREEVFNFDWYSVVPPTPDEFRQLKRT